MEIGSGWEGLVEYAGVNGELALLSENEKLERDGKPADNDGEAMASNRRIISVAWASVTVSLHRAAE